VLLLILESLGSTELVFILVMALVFFGPRKLPQISRSLGKNLAEFRRASEDFKRTWDREVTLEEPTAAAPVEPFEEKSILSPETSGRTLAAPSIEPIRPDQVIARNSIGSDPLNSADRSDLTSNFANATEEPPHSPKNDWL
jgi:TatA/E family protein of Tat protein translocase